MPSLADRLNAAILLYSERGREALRMLQERADSDVDLHELALRERRPLVLKPAGGHGGRDVLLGWKASQSEWQASVEQAMGDFWVLQERVRPVAELMPRVEDEPDGLGFEEVDINWGISSWAGATAGRCSERHPGRTAA